MHINSSVAVSSDFTKPRLLGKSKAKNPSSENYLLDLDDEYAAQANYNNRI